MTPGKEATQRYSRYAWSILGYNIAVILWGAFVRASGSGAGCGDHWPLCNGEVVPPGPTLATVIEFTHRVTSGISVMAVVLLCWWGYKLYERSHKAFRASIYSVGFILVEAALGAGLVLLQYVEQNKSIGRAFYLAAHLTNTLFLLASITVAAWYATREGEEAPAHPLPRSIVLALCAALLAGITGAVAALGDTIFPAASLGEGFRADFSSVSHPLLRLRLAHPMVAILTGLWILYVGLTEMRHATTPGWRRAATAVSLLTAFQLLAGAVNVALLAPVYMQIVHLFLATLLWVALVVLLLERWSVGVPLEDAPLAHPSPAGAPA